jgi:Zn-dependent protease with chaperone function
LTALLGFLLGTAAVMAVAGALVSLLSLAGWPLVARLPSALRADASLVVALLPAFSSLAVGLAVALPSLRHALGLGADHCAEHLHHAHLCWLHASDLPPSLAVLGMAALAAFAWRVSGPLARTWRTARISRELERISQREGGLVWVPGITRICHVAGVITPTIYVSRRLIGELSPDTLQAVLDHERAHVARRDPTVGWLLSMAGAFGLPVVADGWRAAWRQAAEEAADERAAEANTPLLVASALVEYARLQGPTETLGLGFGPVGIEPRVLRLVELEPVVRPPLALPLLLLAVVLGNALAVSFSEPIHHRAEDLVHAVVDTVYYRQ